MHFANTASIWILFNKHSLEKRETFPLPTKSFIEKVHTFFRMYTIMSNIFHG